jgi:hypothetical protein
VTTEDTAGRRVTDLDGTGSGQRSLWHPLVVLPELAWMLALVFGYSLARLVVVDPAGALRNARALWTAERDLHLPSEATFQQLVLHRPELLRLANDYYASAHFPVTAAFLFWVYVWRHDAWRWVRNAMTAFTAAALLIEALLPMAPPRLVPSFGLVDTGRALGQSVYPASPHNGVANQFAAMPSVHVGWAVLVGACLVLIARGRWRWLALVHPVLTVLVVTVTANHYWSDAIVAVLLVAGAFLLPVVARRRPAGRELPAGAVSG